MQKAGSPGGNPAFQPVDTTFKGCLFLLLARFAGLRCFGQNFVDLGVLFFVQHRFDFSAEGFRRGAHFGEERAAGFAVLTAEGSYFLIVDLAASGIEVDDMTFCERAVCEAGVAAIPLSVFYAENPVRSVIRLCFAKRPDVLDEGIARLSAARALFQ